MSKSIGEGIQGIMMGEAAAYRDDEPSTLVDGARELGSIMREAYVNATPGDHISKHRPWMALSTVERERYNKAARAVIQAVHDRGAAEERARNDRIARDCGCELPGPGRPR